MASIARTGLVVLADSLTSLQSTVSDLDGEVTTYKSDINANTTAIGSLITDVSGLKIDVAALQAAVGGSGFVFAGIYEQGATNYGADVADGKLVGFHTTSAGVFTIDIEAPTDGQTLRLLNANVPATEPYTIAFQDAGGTDLLVLGAGESCRLIWYDSLSRWLKVDGI